MSVSHVKWLRKMYHFPYKVVVFSLILWENCHQCSHVSFVAEQQLIFGCLSHTLHRHTTNELCSSKPQFHLYSIYYFIMMLLNVPTFFFPQCWDFHGSEIYIEWAREWKRNEIIVITIDTRKFSHRPTAYVLKVAVNSWS